MTVGELKDALGLVPLCENEEALSKQVSGGYCGDLLSWVMSRAQAGDAWMTVTRPAPPVPAHIRPRSAGS